MSEQTDFGNTVLGDPLAGDTVFGNDVFVTDGGLETDLMFHHGIDLPEFAAFPLLDTDSGTSALARYFDGYATVARAVGAGLLLESPTWRANLDWGARLGRSPGELRAVNVRAIEFLRERAAVLDRTRVLVSGMVGPRGDGYQAGAPMTPDEAAEYHLPQLQAFAAAGADLASGYTFSYPGEAVGVSLAARSAGLPVMVSFTVETDGRLPDGTPLAEAIAAVETVAAPEFFLVNCAHPSHVARALTGLPAHLLTRIQGVRCNASAASHAELDEATELDEGVPAEFAEAHRPLLALLPALRVAGGCCGTDARHVAALWQQVLRPRKVGPEAASA